MNQLVHKINQINSKETWHTDSLADLWSSQPKQSPTITRLAVKIMLINTTFTLKINLRNSYNFIDSFDKDDYKATAKSIKYPENTDRSSQWRLHLKEVYCIAYRTVQCVLACDWVRMASKWKTGQPASNVSQPGQQADKTKGQAQRDVVIMRVGQQ